MRAYAADTALLVIDYQEKLVPAMAEYAEWLKCSQILIKGMIELDVPVIVTQQYTKGLGETVHEMGCRMVLTKSVSAVLKMKISARRLSG